MTNGELIKKQGLVKNTFYKINNEQTVTTDALLRICNVLDYDIYEIVECVKI